MELLNPQTLETFRELMDPGELRDFLQRARQELLRSLGQMQAYFAAKEWDRLKVVAQRLRGTLGSVGCDALFAFLDQMEAQLRAEPLVILSPAQMQALNTVAQRTAQHMGHVITGIR